VNAPDAVELELGDFRWIGPEPDVCYSDKLQKQLAPKVLAEARHTLLSSASKEALETYQACIGLSQLLGEIDSERLVNVSLHPSFRYWQRALRRIDSQRESLLWWKFARHAADFAWPELSAMKRLADPLHVYTDPAGGLRCVTRGFFIELGPSYASARVLLLPSQSGIQIACPDGLNVYVSHEDLNAEDEDDPPNLEDHGFVLNRLPTIAEERIQLCARDSWLRARLSGSNQRSDGVEFFAVDDETYLQRPDSVALQGVLDLIRSAWPAGYEDLCRYVKVVLMADFGPNEHRAFTVSSRQGAIFIGVAPPHQMTEMLLHESAHVKLRQIQLIDSLLLDELNQQMLFRVPWRPDPRPIEGIFEGLFVFLHVAEYEVRTQWGAGDLNARLRKRISDLRSAGEILESHARLTLAGRRLLSAMEAWTCSIASRSGMREA
jgi:hypothetical protein